MELGCFSKTLMFYTAKLKAVFIGFNSYGQTKLCTTVSLF